MYSSAAYHTVDCSDFICDIYTDNVVTSSHELIVYVAYIWHLRGIFVSGTYLAIMCGGSSYRLLILFGLVYSVMWGIYVDHSRNTVGHTCVM